MNTTIVTVEDPSAGQAVLRRAGEIIKAGGLVAFPTETVYGLGGDALNGKAAGKIYAAKGRPSDNPLIIHICQIQDLETVARDIPEAAYRLAARFWPGPLTMIFHKKECVPKETTGGLETVAVRMPDHPLALGLIQAAGGFVAAPSANQSGRPSPTLARYVIEDLQGRVDMILDGGPTAIGLESTILDMTGPVPAILRPGLITTALLTEVIGPVIGDGEEEGEPDQDTGREGGPAKETEGEGEPDQETAGQPGRQEAAAGRRNQAPLAPGMKYRHYAPQGQLVIIEGAEDQVIPYINRRLAEDRAAGKRTGVIGTAATVSRYQADSIKDVGRREDEAAIARSLFRILREFDEEHTAVIYTEAFARTGMGQAIMNRLLKAAGHHVINVSQDHPAV